MKDNRKVIIENLEQVRGLLITTLNLLDDENKDGKQFDYANSPRLSDNFDAANRTMKRIEKIVYQE
jgi:hypothetical protein